MIPIDTFAWIDVFCGQVSSLLDDTIDTFVLADVLYDPNVSPLLYDATTPLC